MKVPMLDLTREYKRIKSEVMAKVESIFDEQSFVLGKHVKELEENLKTYLNVRDVIGVSSGTDALLISLMSLGVGEDDEVILPSFTFFATAGSVARLGARPIFADIDIETYNISPDDIEKKITKKTKVIVPVHLYGHPVEMDRIMEISKSYGLGIVEDNAQAIGSEYKGKKTGSFGIAGCLSFYPTKNLGGAGDGGAISTNDENVSRKCRMIRVHGAEKRYYHDVIGLNGRLDELQAAYINSRFKRIEDNNNERREIAKKYNYLLSDLQVKELLFTPVEKTNCKHVYHQYTIRVPRYRDKLREYLLKNEIGCDIYYPLPLHLQKAFSYLNYKEGSLPNTEKISSEVLSLPIFPGLTEEEIMFVSETIKDFFKHI